MAAAELYPLVLTRDTLTDLTTANQAVMDSATGCYVDFFDTDQNIQAGRLVLIVGVDTAQNDGGSGITILTSTEKPFTGSGMADFADDLSSQPVDFVGADNNYVSVIGPLETAKYVDTDGYINIELSTADTHGNVYITALVVP
jgi:hypothetical protein